MAVTLTMAAVRGVTIAARNITERDYRETGGSLFSSIVRFDHLTASTINKSEDQRGMWTKMGLVQKNT